MIGGSDVEFRTIEHTADIGIEVQADTLVELFEGAAHAMFTLMVDPSEVSRGVEREYRLEAGDLGELMFKWLNELLFTVDAERLLFCEFEVSKVENENLDAVARGEAVDPGRHHLKGEIKAATYHEMLVERGGRGWRARVIFDV